MKKLTRGVYISLFFCFILFFTKMETEAAGETWKFENGNWYLSLQNGSNKTGWHWDDGYQDWFYLKPGDGAMAKGWVWVGGWYFLDYSSGRMYSTEWFDDTDGNRYYLQDNGLMAREWFFVDGSWNYFNDSGHMRTGWQWIGNAWYYLQPGKGNMLTGWQVIGGARYYLQPHQGNMWTGWQWIGNAWYYLQPHQGNMWTGWHWIQDGWYYLNPLEGNMLKDGWHWIDNECYYLYSNGKMASNTVIDGYRVLSDGRWDRDIVPEAPEKGDNEAAVAYLKTFTYVPYKYGGKDTKGWDCSGFVTWALNNAFKVSVPYRTSEGYMTAGKAVDPKDTSKWRAGDVICDVGGGHVSLYLGNGQIMHAANQKYGTVITSVNDYLAHWNKVATVRRFF